MAPYSSCNRRALPDLLITITTEGSAPCSTGAFVGKANRMCLSVVLYLCPTALISCQFTLSSIADNDEKERT